MRLMERYTPRTNSLFFATTVVVVVTNVIIVIVAIVLMCPYSYLCFAVDVILIVS